MNKKLKTNLLSTLPGSIALACALATNPATAVPLHIMTKAMPGAAETIPQPYLALTNANVVDVKTGEILESRTVVLKDGLIESITTSTPPTGAEIQDLNGYYIIPGLFDAHTHVNTLDGYQLALESGVTTLRSGGSFGKRDTAIQKAVEGGYVVGPEMLGTGVYIKRQINDEALDDPRLFKFLNKELSDPEDLREVVRINIENGAKWIKTRVGGNTAGGTADAFWIYYGEDQVAAITDEAKKHGVQVLCHIQGEEAAIVAARAGCATIEHGQYITEKALQTIKELDVAWSPTYKSTEGFMLPHDDYNSTTARLVAPWILKNQQNMLAKAHEMGVKIIAGVDSGYAEDSVTRIAGEINSYIDYGNMSPLEAIQSATIEQAKLYGIDDRTGSIEEGKEADIVILERNPISEPMNIHNPMMVISNGRIGVPFRSPHPGLVNQPDRTY